MHEIENLFLAPQIVFETLKYHDQLKDLSTPQAVEQALVDAAKNLNEWIASDWLAWELRKLLPEPERRIGGDKPRESLTRYLAEVRKRVAKIPVPDEEESRYTEKLAAVDDLIAKGHLARLPGKQILREFLRQHTKGSISAENYLNTAVSTALDQKIPMPEIERLKRWLRQ